MSAVTESDGLHERARAFVKAFESESAMPESFDDLGCDIARFQAAHIPGYARLCDARGVRPSALRAVSDAPAVPTEAFKVSRVAAFPEQDARAVFRTSGTTLGSHGTHAMRRVDTYDDAARVFGKVSLMAGLPPRVPVLVLAPSPTEMPSSSLSHMLGVFVDAFGALAHDAPYFIEDGILDIAALDARVARAMVEKTSVLMLGTSFAFVHLLDAAADAGFRLPRGSRVMQTGGFKGKGRDVDARVLRASLATAFGIEPTAIVSEYGMTELSSQFYETSAGVYVEPPWARVVPVDPVTLAPVADGQEGVARIVDLMNVDSAVAVLAADRVRRVPGGFELNGRWPGAAPRGCSIAVDEMLGSSAPS